MVGSSHWSFDKDPRAGPGHKIRNLCTRGPRCGREVVQRAKIGAPRHAGGRAPRIGKPGHHMPWFRSGRPGSTASGVEGWLSSRKAAAQPEWIAEGSGTSPHTSRLRLAYSSEAKVALGGVKNENWNIAILQPKGERRINPAPILQSHADDRTSAAEDRRVGR